VSDFSFSRQAVSGKKIRELVADDASGAYVSFEGWVCAAFIASGNSKSAISP